MKAYLMYRNRDFDLKTSPPPFETALMQDLELDVLFSAMSGGDAFLLEVAKKAVLASLREPAAILYRQQILADCLKHPAVIREMYAITVEAIERERKVWGWSSDRYPSGLLHRSVEVLQLFFDLLRGLRHFADEHGAKFGSEGFATLFGMLSKELDDEYLNVVADHLRRLAFRDGVLMSAELDEGNKGAHYILHTRYIEQSWLERLRSWMKQLFSKDRSGFTYRIADGDESGFRALEELRSRGISPAASALGQSTDHILSFFTMLRLELGFYVGCLNLRDRLFSKSEPTCFPEPLAADKPMFFSRGLYDPCLSLSVKEKVVGNDINAAGKLLVMITGANQGGKSTALRSIGLAQLMMQCGMFVPADSFRASLCDGVFTHYKREEDAAMRSGKLDEELSRMSLIVDNLTSGSIVLFNESFASTNEREGSEIARQIVRALVEKGVRVFYVTHLFDLANSMHLAKMDAALFLRAERAEDGRRTFRLMEGQPLPTSYGEDLYRRIFGEVHDAEEVGSVRLTKFEGARSAVDPAQSQSIGTAKNR
jgi:hypothetical protein